MAAIAGWLAVVAIVCATLSSIEMRLQTGIVSANVERFFAFFGAALALGIAYPRHRLAIFALGLCFVIAIEASQTLVATRHGDWRDVCVKTAGAMTALIGLRLVELFLLPRRS